MTRGTKFFLALFSLFYLALIFPFCYFRHDDWFNLGNSLLILKNPGFAFSTDMIFFDGPRVWFFRPFFKILPAIFFKIYGFNYYLWVLTTFILVLAVLWVGKKTLDRLASPHSGEVFVAFSAVSILTHFGSIFWFGEGGVNIPQVLLLFLSLYFWVKFLTLESNGNYLQLAVSLLFFILAALFKEAFVFHAVFMFFLLIYERKIRENTWLKKGIAFLPFAFISLVYLYFRLCILPFNPEYVPKIELTGILKQTSLLIFVFGGSIALFALLFFPSLGIESLKRWVFRKPGYLLFFLLAVLPYIGHPFFSFGWMYSLGCYLFFIFGLEVSPVSFEVLRTRRCFISLLIFFLLSGGVVIGSLSSHGWWQWKKSEQNFVRLIQSMPDNIKTVTILDANKGPHACFKKVIGNPSALWHLWQLFHPHPAQFELISKKNSEGEVFKSKSDATIMWTLSSAVQK